MKLHPKNPSQNPHRILTESSQNPHRILTESSQNPHKDELTNRDRFRLAAAAAAAEGQEEDQQVEGAGANLQRNVTTLVNAMRDLLGSIHLPDLGRHEEQDEEADHDDEDDEEVDVESM